LSASQADRAGSIPATRSTLPHKGFSLILAIDEKPSFTGSFTVPVHFLASLSVRMRSLIAAVRPALDVLFLPSHDPGDLTHR
jgi:hypothetical protein